MFPVPAGLRDECTTSCLSVEVAEVGFGGKSQVTKP